uniref:Eukaryotic translation initiation factor 3 subunit H n=1 Tax=Pseudo-nitzschia arenysensis TaxID=697910 RepID=A0A7R9ZTW8_9STRA|mmetsp:Transcript_464/g.1083  ORF Transcript_464/g.1083 Transcript_464/m.1083 type:complete len:294 (+) Transcript_464:145-1026(+)|eukprot:CAMPEP_0116127590 /NCGR_PEP_ID=MMETSP0329-20121206/6918_1 /TAXON_ID=697910 /ORGANISM="Pseudo-nitzschia arenysensis, Strain B593" /LENGTH=293 /DNA_ID=CAMNT_0003621693 /DNA_START=89 /DNA_END=970 /DNA_ORIENTATION=-
MAAVFEPDSRISEVQIEGLAMMKIVKHCHESLPSMVQGALLGLAVEGGVLEVTHAFPNPTGKNDDDVDEEYQFEMMRMLREVNVDNNCVGWYQSVYLGVYSTSSVLENQFSYQTEVSPNAVVILYDPLQTANGSFCLKAFRLSDACVAKRKSGTNDFIKPANIFEELPIKCSNPSLANAMLQDWTPKSDIALDRLDMSTQPFLEKHLESLCGWVDELAAEQQKFQYYTRHLARGNNKSKAGWATSEAPSRMESLLVTNQIENYCEQMDKYAGSGLGKLFLAGGLHKGERSTSA